MGDAEIKGEVRKEGCVQKLTGTAGSVGRGQQQPRSQQSVHKGGWEQEHPMCMRHLWHLSSRKPAIMGRSRCQETEVLETHIPIRPVLFAFGKEMRLPQTLFLPGLSPV